MNVEQYIYNEQLKQSEEATAIIKMLEEFKKECLVMPEFHLKTARYIAYAVTDCNVTRHTAKTLKTVTALAGEVGGLYNHTFKWCELPCDLSGVSWAYVNNLKKPLVALAVLKYNISLGELKDTKHGETTC